jgi:hypothetical protein
MAPGAIQPDCPGYTHPLPPLPVRRKGTFSARGFNAGSSTPATRRSGRMTGASIFEKDSALEVLGPSLLRLTEVNSPEERSVFIAQGIAIFR